MNAFKGLMIEIKNLYLQVSRINNLKKAIPGSLEHTAFLYAEKSRIRSNLKRIVLMGAALFILILSFLIISMIKSKITFGTENIGYNGWIYLSVFLFLLVYLFAVAKLLSEPVFDEKKGKIVYRSFWLILYFSGVVYALTAFSEFVIFEGGGGWFFFIPVIAVIPILTLAEIILVVFLHAAVIVASCLITATPLLHSLLFTIFILLLIFIVGQSSYMGHMDTLYTKYRIQQKGYKIQKRFEGIIVDLFDEVYEICLNTNDFTLLHNKGTFKPSQMKDSYEESIKYIAYNLLHPDDADSFLNRFLLDNIIGEFRSGITQIYHEARRLNMKGNYAWVAMLLIRESTNDSEDFTLMWLLEDIDRRKTSEAKLKTEAQMDALTQLYNKVTTKNMIEEYISSSDGMNGSHAFVIIDMDNFKAINDNLGHFAGDAVLLEFSNELKTTFRETDIIGRIGGDEFVVLIKNVQSVALVCDKVQRLTSGFKKYGIDHNIKYKLSTSIGIAIYDKDGKSYDELYKSADSALYESKRNGKDQYKFCIRENNDDLNI